LKLIHINTVTVIVLVTAEYDEKVLFPDRAETTVPYQVRAYPQTTCSCIPGYVVYLVATKPIRTTGPWHQASYIAKGLRSTFTGPATRRKLNEDAVINLRQ